MPDETTSLHAEQAALRALDLDASAVLLAERLIGEILGFDLVDWAAVEAHKGRRFSFGRQRRGEPSIHDQLKPLLQRCDPGRGDFAALKPSPVVNANLSRLVGCLCRHVGRHELPPAAGAAAALERTVEQDHLHLAVVEHLIERTETHQGLRQRAALVKTVAAAAESELEKHFSDLIVERLESSFLAGGAVDRHKIIGLRDQARGRVAQARAHNRQDLAGLAAPVLALDDEALTRIEMAKILLSRFPYVRNYELMLQAEIAMLQRPLAPRFARERMIAAKAGAIDGALIERWDRALAGIAGPLVGAGPDCLFPPGSTCLRDRTIALCGSGPLPLSALFLHLFTGAALVLIDADRVAAERSERLIASLVQLEILPAGALTIRCANAGEVAFQASGTPRAEGADAAVACDAVMIASLVDHDAKAAVAARLERDPGAPELLIMRSATGLSARLAYDAIPTETFSRGRLAYCGETLPATQVATHLDRTQAMQRRVASLTSADVLAIAHEDVVNTTEVYRRLALPADGLGLDFGACATTEDWMAELEAAGAALGPG